MAANGGGLGFEEGGVGLRKKKIPLHSVSLFSLGLIEGPKGYPRR